MEKRNLIMLAIIMIIVVIVAVFLIVKLKSENNEDKIVQQFLLCIKSNCIGKFTNNDAFVNCIDTQCQTYVANYVSVDVTKLSQKYKNILSCLATCRLTEGNLGPCTPACLTNL